jgi:hypothetical protein
VALQLRIGEDFPEGALIARPIGAIDAGLRHGPADDQGVDRGHLQPDRGEAWAESATETSTGTIAVTHVGIVKMLRYTFLL